MSKKLNYYIGVPILILIVVCICLFSNQIATFSHNLSIAFKIKPDSIKKITYNNSIISWEKPNGGVTGYELYPDDGINSPIIISNIQNPTYLVENPAGTVMQYKVRTYRIFLLSRFYSPYIKITTVTNPDVVKDIKYDYETKVFRLNWKKVKSSGYEIHYSKSKSFANFKTLQVKTNSCTIPQIPDDQKYYYRIRAFVEGGNRLYFGKYSAINTNGCFNFVSSFQTRHTNNNDRTNNLILSCRAIDNTVIAPGETFSFNQIVGQRTSEKGYLPATIFKGKTETGKEVGGGICQVASTIFNAVLQTDFPIIERHQHSQKVSYVSLGKDAAIYWKWVDLKFKNNSPYSIKINMKVENGMVYCSIYSSDKINFPSITQYVETTENVYILKRFVSGKEDYMALSVY